MEQYNKFGLLRRHRKCKTMFIWLLQKYNHDWFLHSFLSQHTLVFKSEDYGTYLFAQMNVNTIHSNKQNLFDIWGRYILQKISLSKQSLYSTLFLQSYNKMMYFLIIIIKIIPKQIKQIIHHIFLLFSLDQNSNQLVQNVILLIM